MRSPGSTPPAVKLAPNNDSIPNLASRLPWMRSVCSASPAVELAPSQRLDSQSRLPASLDALALLGISRRRVDPSQRLDSQSRLPASLDALALLGISRRRVDPSQRLVLFSLDLAVNWEAISAIGQIIGALAVVISLIYLAKQVGSSARETRLSSMRSTLDLFTRLNQQVAEHADLTELCNRGFNDFESLEGADRMRFNSYMHSAFRSIEAVYYQHLDGHSDPRLWRGMEVVLREINALPGVQAWWRLHSHWFDEAFAKFINQHQQRAKSAKDVSQAIPKSTT
jgi:hypothetical protein